MGHRGVTLAVRMQQVGQVGVQRGHPVLVAQLAAALDLAIREASLKQEDLETGQVSLFGAPSGICESNC